MELADVVDSKSTAGDSVPVRVRPPAPNKTGHPFGVSCFIWYRVVYGGSRPAVFFASAKNTSAQGDPPSHGGALCPLDLGDGSSPTPLGCPVLFDIAWSMEALDRPYFSPRRKIPAHKATHHPTAARCAPLDLGDGSSPTPYFRRTIEKRRILWYTRWQQPLYRGFISPH